MPAAAFVRWRLRISHLLALFFTLAIILTPPILPQYSQGNALVAAAAATTSSPSAADVLTGDVTESKSARLRRKQSRLTAARKRVESHAKRVADKTKKSAKRIADALTRRQSRSVALKKRHEKARVKSDAYWSRKKESLSPTVIARGADRLKKLRRLADAAESGVVSIAGSSTYNQLVDATPRPYWILISFTALDESYKCAICKQAHSAFETIGPLVAAHRNMIANSTERPDMTQRLLTFNSSVAVGEREQLQRAHDESLRGWQEVFVVEVDISNNRQAFDLLNLRTAPTIVLLPPTAAASPAPGSTLLTSLPSKYRYVPQRAEMAPSDLTSLIDAHLALKLPTQQSTSSPFTVNALMDKLSGFDQLFLTFLSAIALLLLTGLVYWLYINCVGRTSTTELISARGYGVDNYMISAKALPPLTITRVWCIILSWAIFTFAIGGGMFNIIKQTDFDGGTAGITVDHKWISGEYMDQKVVEGYIMGAMQLSLAIMVICMNYVAHRYRSVDESATVGWIKWFLSWFYSPLLFLALALLIWLQFINFYSRKNGGYRYGWLWNEMNKDWKKIIPWPMLHTYFKLTKDEIYKRLL